MTAKTWHALTLEAQWRDLADSVIVARVGITDTLFARRSAKVLRTLTSERSVAVFTSAAILTRIRRACVDFLATVWTSIAGGAETGLAPNAIDARPAVPARGVATLVDVVLALLTLEAGQAVAHRAGVKLDTGPAVVTRVVIDGALVGVVGAQSSEEPREADTDEAVVCLDAAPVVLAGLVLADRESGLTVRAGVAVEAQAGVAFLAVPTYPVMAGGVLAIAAQLGTCLAHEVAAALAGEVVNAVDAEAAILAEILGTVVVVRATECPSEAQDADALKVKLSVDTLSFVEARSIFAVVDFSLASIADEKGGTVAGAVFQNSAIVLTGQRTYCEYNTCTC